MEWQSIETAPERERVLVWAKDKDWVDGYWSVYVAERVGDRWLPDPLPEQWEELAPTHWMPLPQQPKEQANG